MEELTARGQEILNRVSLSRWGAYVRTSITDETHIAIITVTNDGLAMLKFVCKVLLALIFALCFGIYGLYHLVSIARGS